MKATLGRVLLALFIGVACGGACVFLGVAFDASYAWSRAHEGLIWALPLVGVTELALYHAVGLSINMGSPDVALAAREGMDVPCTLAAAVLTATCASVAFGASVGKEAVAVQMCAALSLALAQVAMRFFHFRLDVSTSLVCGMAAGIGALLHAPVAGVLMAFETMRARGWGVRRAALVGAVALVASAAAYATACLAGSGPFSSVPFSAESLFAGVIEAVSGEAAGAGEAASGLAAAGAGTSSVAGAALGLAGVTAVCVLAGLLYGGALRRLRGGLRRVNLTVGSLNVAPYVIIMIGGLAAAAVTVGFGLQACKGSGFDLLPAAFAGQSDVGLFFAKAVLTILVLGFGFKGGEIMPALVMGALLGSALAVALGMGAGAVAASALLGMLAFFGASSRCPLAACALGVKLLVLP